MKLYEKVKQLREDKKLSQDYIAHQLGLSQSQYSRRENGQISFIAEEISQLAKLMETTIAELYGEETIIFNNHDQKGGNFGQYLTVSDKLIEQYEARLKEKDDMIHMLKGLLEKE